jgi:6-bladed beta-propeller
MHLSNNRHKLPLRCSRLSRTGLGVVSALLIILTVACNKTQIARKQATFRSFESVFKKVREIAIAGIDPRNALAFARDSKGAIYVSDGAQRNVRKVDSNGRLLKVIGGPGSGPGQFLVPWSIACDDQDNLYVLDIKTGRLSIFSETGDFKNSIVVSLFGFAGVALRLGSAGNVYIGGIQPDRPGSPLLYKVSRDGQLMRSFFPRDPLVDKLHLHIVGGVDFDLDHSENLYAIQPVSAKVSVFSPDGQFIKEFGNEPSFYRPPFKFPAHLPSENKEVQALLAGWTELYEIQVLQKEQLVLLSYAVHSPVAYGLEIYGTDGNFRIGEIGSSGRPVLTSADGHVYFFDQAGKTLVVWECSLMLPEGKKI